MLTSTSLTKLNQLVKEKGNAIHLYMVPKGTESCKLAARAALRLILCGSYLMEF